LSTMAKAKAKRTKRVMVIGGGISGAEVAMRLGRVGIDVHLIEREQEIGGHIREMGCKAADACLRCNVCTAHETLRLVSTVPAVHIHTATELVELKHGSNSSRFTAVLTSSARKDDITSLDVDTVVIATGFDPYNPAENPSYGYGRISNVITGTDAERQLALQQKLTRESDGERPRRVAFIQCVGSRTEEIFRRPDDTDFCSTVCCAYALRMAQQLKSQANESEITVFYMDIQNFGKGFNEFYQTCKNMMRFVRSRPYELRAGRNGTVRVMYSPEKSARGAEEAVMEEEFDLVVLAVGIRPRCDAEELADICSIPRDEQGFFGLKNGSALPDLQQEGIYVVGAGESPKDIAGCIAQAAAVSAMVLSGM
jgi:heterodisulfide reductase subunit A